MNAASEEGTVERDYVPEASCKDSFRYHLMGENGRYRFVSVRFVGLEGCQRIRGVHIGRLLQSRVGAAEEPLVLGVVAQAGSDTVPRTPRAGGTVERDGVRDVVLALLTRHFRR